MSRTHKDKVDRVCSNPSGTHYGKHYRNSRIRCALREQLAHGQFDLAERITYREFGYIDNSYFVQSREVFRVFANDVEVKKIYTTWQGLKWEILKLYKKDSAKIYSAVPAKTRDKRYFMLYANGNFKWKRRYIYDW